MALATQWLVAFLVSFTTVGLKITQQQNVIHSRKYWAIGCSFAMVACDVGLIGLIAKNSWAIAFPCGCGGALGCVLAIHYYPKGKS